MLARYIRPNYSGSRTKKKPTQSLLVPSEVLGIGLVDLEHNSCRFPISRDDDTHFFCGEVRRDPKTSYCSHHHSIVWHKRRNQ